MAASPVQMMKRAWVADYMAMASASGTTARNVPELPYGTAWKERVKALYAGAGADGDLNCGRREDYPARRCADAVPSSLVTGIARVCSEVSKPPPMPTRIGHSSRDQDMSRKAVTVVSTTHYV